MPLMPTPADFRPKFPSEQASPCLLLVGFSPGFRLARGLLSHAIGPVSSEGALPSCRSRRPRDGWGITQPSALVCARPRNADGVAGGAAGRARALFQLPIARGTNATRILARET